jgi:hypothetical protein
MKLSLSRGLACATLVAAVPLAVFAASPSRRTAAEPTGEVIGLFEGMESGAIEVKVIPKDSTEGTITVKNKTGKPLTIKLPDAFAGVPVLAQGFGMGDMGGGGMMGGGMGGQNQGLGGGMMGGGMMGAGMGGMGGQAGGFFNVAPDKVAKGKITTVCLDHGKKDPNPRVPYKLIPIESYAKNAVVAEVVKMLVRGEIDQYSAQAASWHLQNDLSWEELAGKIGAKHLNGTVEPYFTRAQLDRAFGATRVAEQRAEKASKEKEKSQRNSIGDDLAKQG